MTASPESLRTIPRQEETSKGDLRPLRPIQRYVFGLAALGFRPEQIAEEMHKKPRAVRYHIEIILKSFGVNSMLKAVIRGVETGNIDIRRVTKDLDTKTIERLSPEEKKLLDEMTWNGGENSSYGALADFLGIANNLLGKRLKTIYKKLEIKKGRRQIIRAALLYLAYKREDSPLVTH